MTISFEWNKKSIVIKGICSRHNALILGRQLMKSIEVEEDLTVLELNEGELRLLL